jgi:hypothetical protein
VGHARRERGRRVRARLRRPEGEEEGHPGAEGRPQGRRRARAGDGRGPRGRVHRVAPHGGPPAEGAGSADGVPRDHPRGHPNALSHTREIDQRLVDAQETRRVLDRLVGYTISPLLWKKVAPRLSAGRVQSVAVRVLVGRERERLDFVSASYWDLQATLEQDRQRFEATMVALGGRRFATGRDFDENTGRSRRAPTRSCSVRSRPVGWRSGCRASPGWSPRSRAGRSRGAGQPPFITSTLQQEANRKLGLSARRAMQVAQASTSRASSPTCGRTPPRSRRRPSAPRARPSRGGTGRSTSRPSPASSRPSRRRAGGARGDPPGRHRDEDEG